MTPRDVADYYGHSEIVVWLEVIVTHESTSSVALTNMCYALTQLLYNSFNMLVHEYRALLLSVSYLSVSHLFSPILCFRSLPLYCLLIIPSPFASLYPFSFSTFSLYLSLSFSLSLYLCLSPSHSLFTYVSPSHSLFTYLSLLLTLFSS